MPQTGNVAAAKEALSALVGLPASNLVAADVYGCRIYREMEDTESLNYIKDDDLVHTIPAAWSLPCHYGLPWTLCLLCLSPDFVSHFHAWFSLAHSSNSTFMSCRPCQLTRRRS